jgi:uncharacterized protein (TIGR00730 family)
MSDVSTPPPFSLCVYCGSRPGLDPAYAEVAREVGRWIGAQGGQLVYGGGRHGLMGLVAEATLEAGGRVVGVIPRSLMQREHANHACTELHVVESMHDRKRLMAEHAHAFLALPGGIGTFEEFFEVWTWRQLGYHDKPVGLLNTAGYYDRLLDFVRGSVDQGFLAPWQLDLVRIEAEASPLLAALKAAAHPETTARYGET